MITPTKKDRQVLFTQW